MSPRWPSLSMSSCRMICILFLFAPVAKSISAWPAEADRYIKAPAKVRGRYGCLCCDVDTLFDNRVVLTARKREPFEAQGRQASRSPKYEPVLRPGRPA